MEEKEKIPSEWNGQREATNTQCDSGRVERMIRRKWRQSLVDGVVGRTTVTPNMILGQFRVSWRGQI